MNNTNFKLKFHEKDLISVAVNSNIVFFLLLFPFFKNSGFESVPFLAVFCNLLLVVEFFLFLFIEFKLKEFNKFIKLLCVYGLWAFIISPILGGHTSDSFFYLISMFGIIFFADIALKVNFKKAIKNFSFSFNFMILLNALSLLLFKNGFPSSLDIGEVYLFGLRTGFSLVIIPAVIFNLINAYVNYDNKINFSLICCLIFSFFTLIYKWVATGLIELILIILLYVLIPKNLKKRLVDNIEKVFLLIFIFNISMTFLGNSLNFVSNIAGLMNKDVTLSGRTYIWEKSVEKISENPVFGYGLDSTVDIFGIYKPSHNQWMHIALSSGLVGMFLLFYIFYKSCKILSKQEDFTMKYILSVAIISISIGCITEIQIYFPFIYLMFFLPYTFNYYNNEV